MQVVATAAVVARYASFQNVSGVFAGIFLLAYNRQTGDVVVVL